MAVPSVSRLSDAGLRRAPQSVIRIGWHRGYGKAEAELSFGLILQRQYYIREV